MFVLLNGSFGIGKTTVAAILAASLPGARIYDPERVGSLLRRLPAWCFGLDRQPEDFQDLRLWRSLIGVLARREHRHSQVVVVPMAFTNLDYLDGFASELAKSAPVNRLCLVAPLEVVRARLEGRGVVAGTVPGDWVLRRSRECIAAHRNPAFGHPVDATRRPDEIAADIRSLIGLVEN